MSNEPLITRYRPHEWEELVGHEKVIAALRRVAASDSRPHAYLLTGPSGIGKTTIARIIAREIGAEVLEIDAASNSSVDAARQLVEIGQYRSLGAAERKMFIIDEFHGLSRQAMDALLKTLEEPPDHLFFALCTTELSRVRETVQTRCYPVALHPLRSAEIEELLTAICAVEGWEPSGDVMTMIVQASTGQPRKALSMLEAVHDAPSREEAERVTALLASASEAGSSLFRDLFGGKTWVHIRPALERLQAEQADWDALAAEAAGYISTMIIGEKDDKRARDLWQLLDALTFPSNTFNRRAAFVAAVGRILWGGQ
jgi:DNA polymerase III gamma/tau subunit